VRGYLAEAGENDGPAPARRVTLAFRVLRARPYQECGWVARYIPERVGAGARTQQSVAVVKDREWR